MIKTNRRKALFLDRDGVINKEKNYLYRIEDFEFINGVFDGCRFFQSIEYFIVIVTNQAGLAKGYYKESDFKLLTDWMLAQFSQEDITINGVYHCPHHPEITGPCSCRKPAPGLVLSAKDELDIDLAESLLVGDKFSDVEAGMKAGIGKNYLITTGHEFDRTEAHKRGYAVIEKLTDLISGEENSNAGILMKKGLHEIY